MLVFLIGRFDTPEKQRVALKGLHELAVHPACAVSQTSVGPPTSCSPNCFSFYFNYYQDSQLRATLPFHNLPPFHNLLS